MKKISTSNIKEKPKKSYNKPKVVKLADGSEVMQEYADQYVTKRVYGKKKLDVEENELPEDEASNHKFPPPRVHPAFRAKWMSFIDNITERDSFKTFHLHLLEVLCDLYVEYDSLSKTIRTEGRTFKSVTRFGEVIKTRP